MIKYYCDSCKLETKRPYKFSVPCHLLSFRGKVGYVDNDFNKISGRMDDIDLCAKCYNIAFEVALNALNIKDLPK